MLVLTRKEGECIRIDNRIVIRIHNIGKNRVRVAIEAPSDIPIYREEIYVRIAEENKQASRSAGIDPLKLSEVYDKLGITKATGKAAHVGKGKNP